MTVTFEIMKTIQTQTVLTLAKQILILKTFIHFFVMMPFHCIIFNFEKKKKCSIIKKRLLLPKFSQFKVFPLNGELCKKWNLKAIQSN